MSENEEMKAATKKAAKIAVFYLALILLIAWGLSPIDSLHHLSLLIGSVLFLGYCALRDVKQVTYNRLCLECEKDISSIIDTGNGQSNTIQYCPFCGTQLNDTHEKL